MDLDRWFEENEGWRPYADLVLRPPMPEELMEWWPGDVSPDMLARCLELVLECGLAISRGAIYCRVRREYDPDEHRPSDHWATMLALNSPPGLKTTDSFWAGRKPWYEVYGEDYANDVKKRLAKQGVHLKPGDEYMPELANRRGDPDAVVPFGGARSYIRNLCEKRGWAVQGAVNVEAREPDRDWLADENCIPMGEDIVRQKAASMIQSNPDLKRLSRAELKAKVLEKHGPSKRKGRDSFTTR